MKKTFILINSPIFWDAEAESEQYLPPLGLGYIASYLEKINDLDVKILDCVKERKSVNDIINYINEINPDYLGSNIFTQNYKIVKYIFENINVDSSLFIGGQVVKSIYEEILNWNVKNVLNVIIGEGELIIPDIVQNICMQKPEKRVDNILVYRVNSNSVYYPQNISDIFLDRKYLGDEIIINHYGEKEIAIITSRGCMYNCAFCGGAKNLNKDVGIRIRSNDSVIHEIDQILSIYDDIKSIRILDDLFLRNSKSIDNANEIFSNFPQLSWRGMVHVLSLRGSIEKISELKKCGCKELFVGIESGSERIRQRINKKGSIDDVLDVSKAILKSGIDLKGYFIYGFPDETIEDFQKTYLLAKKIRDISLDTTGKFRTSVFQFRPYHGTQLYNEILKSNGIKKDCSFNQEISRFKGRSQFNFDFGNYSLETDKILNEYIIKTQELTKE